MKRIVTIIFLIIFIDTLQAIFLNASPLLSWSEHTENNGSWVNKGILMDTYYCKDKNDMIIIRRKLKVTKFSCIVDNGAELNEVEDVMMNIKEGTLTKIGVTVIITAYSYKDYIYEEAFRIDKKESDEWIELDIIGNYVFLPKKYKINANRKLEFVYNWFNMYGKLENGEYRLVKSVFLEEGETKYFSVEFKID